MHENNPQTGTLYLIPSSLGENELSMVWPSGNIRIVKQLNTFIVENLRTARRFLRRAGYNKDFDEVTFFLLNKHTTVSERQRFLESCQRGESTGLLSEAGTPCIADPGQLIVAEAHEQGIAVKPLSGPSSIILALMVSGMNGQEFCFHGYLPIRQPERIKKIKALERESQKSGATQIFMEAPFRNNSLLADLLKSCSQDARLCIAADLTMPTEFVRTKTVSQWQSRGYPDLHKRPAIFLLGI